MVRFYVRVWSGLRGRKHDEGRGCLVWLSGEAVAHLAWRQIKQGGGCHPLLKTVYILSKFISRLKYINRVILACSGRLAFGCIET